MNKNELFDTFDQKISKSCIVFRDSEYVIQGKFCVISPMGKNRWDIWICNPDDLYMGLGQRKVRNIAAKLFKSTAGKPYTELTSEAYGVVESTELILQNLKLLGIRKKREYSSENLAKLRTHLTEARKVA